jgi:hypothetical protein
MGLMRHTFAQVPWIKLGALAVIVVALTVILGRILQPGYDLYIWFYPAARDILQGQFAYAQIPRLNNPPWILLLLTPLSMLPPAMMHGFLVAVTALALYAAMRPYRRFRAAFVLALISMPMLATVWNGQLEFLSLLGVTWGYSAVQQRRPLRLSVALLLMAAKPQETWLIILLLLVASWRQWSWRDWLKIGVPVGIIALLTSLWLGFDWLTRTLNGAVTYANDWENISLWRLGQSLPAPMGVVLWGSAALITLILLWRARISRQGLALGAVGANLLSPYLTPPHLLMTMAFGWGYLFDRSLPWGALAYLASLTPLLRFASADQSWNQIDLLFPLVVWAGLVWTAWRSK